jgi:hypothetical protein
VLAVVLGLSVLVGVSLGLLGGGGSILTVPILVYVAGLEAKEAIAASLFVVGVTSAFGAVSHARAGRVRWRTGLLFGAAGMAGAYAGGRAGAYVPGSWLLAGFAVMMLATGVAMLRGRRSTGPEIGLAAARREVPVLHVLAEGIVVGLVTGLVGAGGGFLVVPALVLLGGLPMSTAVGTSLVVIALKSAAGFAGYLHSVSIDWSLLLAVTAAAVAGGVLGGRLAGRIRPEVLRRTFGWFVLAMAAVVLSEQAPAGWRLAVLAGFTGVGLAAIAVLRARRGPDRRAGTSLETPDQEVGNMAQEVDLAAFAAAHADGGYVVDVRERGEYLAGHVPGAKLIPLASVPARLGQLPTDRPVYVICASGNRSLTATAWMRSAGIDAYSVAGGTGGWARLGRPVIPGPHENAA